MRPNGLSPKVQLYWALNMKTLAPKGLCTSASEPTLTTQLTTPFPGCFSVDHKPVKAHGEYFHRAVSLPLSRPSSILSSSTGEYRTSGLDGPARAGLMKLGVGMKSGVILRPMPDEMSRRPTQCCPNSGLVKIRYDSRSVNTLRSVVTCTRVRAVNHAGYRLGPAWSEGHY